MPLSPDEEEEARRASMRSSVIPRRQTPGDGGSGNVAPFVDPATSRHVPIEVAPSDAKPGTRRFVAMGQPRFEEHDYGDGQPSPSLFTHDPNVGLTPQQVMNAGRGVGDDVLGVDMGDLGRRKFLPPEAYGTNPQTYSGKQ